MHKGFLKAAAAIGLLSVLLGAFGAHSLKGMVSDHSIATYETAVRYQFYHVFALLAVGILYAAIPLKIMLWSGRFFVYGIILFSGSLYVLAIVQASIKPGYNWIGAITPFGGICFIIGWLLLFVSLYRKN